MAMPLKRRHKKGPVSWKKAKTAKVLFRKIKVLFFVVACACLIVLAVAGASSIKLLSTKFASAVNSPFSLPGSWDRQSPLNILVVNDRGYGILRAIPETNSIIYLKMPQGREKRPVEELEKEIIKTIAVSLDKYILYTPQGEETLSLLLGVFENTNPSNAFGGYSKFVLNFHSH